MKSSRVAAFGAATGALLMSLTLMTAPGTAHASTWDQPVRLSDASPFASCTADTVPGDSYTLNTESESTVAVHPWNPLVTAVAWRQDLWATGSSRGIVVASTKNGGITWKKTVLPGVSECSGGQGRVTNPWLQFGADGTLHATVTIFGGDRSIVAALRSTDAGSTWSAPAALSSDVMPRFWSDKQTVTTDPRDPRRVYVVWNRRDRELDFHEVLFARSDDAGRTWRPTRSIYRPQTPGAGTVGNQIAVLPNGDLVNVFVENEHAIGGAPYPAPVQERVAVMRSSDRGATWTEPVSVPGTFIVGQPLLPDTPWVPVMAPGIVPDIAADRLTGTLYLVWGDATMSGSYSGVALSTSSDGGRTWSTPRKINQTPESPPFGSGQAFLTQVETTITGAVGISYYDFRNNTADPGATTDVWLSTCRARCSAADARWQEEHLAGPFDLGQAPMWFGGPYVGSFVGLSHTLTGFVHAPITTTGDPANPTDVSLARSSFKPALSAGSDAPSR
ncbi:sialidase family protein [Sphaerisporangium sp. TRM90804]|uniref:sialidase family protein n=1 Tax=Sphaerisporangium sp. TRM90804 TaxID=3031113 RepID=UPI0024491EBD|nr:sialidase family protein [Sphaerisporangium sp. TRM90804]MDH2427223.1 sialidase family protein [Sphaerisporangium sp. TRM90804]